MRILLLTSLEKINCRPAFKNCRFPRVKNKKGPIQKIVGNDNYIGFPVKRFNYVSDRANGVMNGYFG
jgi:hypothetical protein